MTTRATRTPRRRTVVALAIVLIVLGAFVVRLIDIQVVNAREHMTDAREMATGRAIELHGTRGDILDATGRVLATSTMLYDVQIDPLLAAKGIQKLDAEGHVVEDADGNDVMVPWPELAAQIAAITGQSADEVRAVVDDALAADPSSRYGMVARYVPTSTYRALAALELPFLVFPPHPSRTYPAGAVAGNLLGFVGSDGQPLEGLEEQQNACLAGADGDLSYQRGADGVIIPGTEVETPAEDGGALQLTIDADLQWYLQQLAEEETARMRAKWGGIMVVEVATGKIRALAESGSVDPNDVDATEPDNRASRLLRYSFEPGSTYKAITAATVIEQAGLTPTSTVYTPDVMYFDNGARIKDSDPHPDMNLTLNGALVISSNVAMAQFGELVPPEVRQEYLERFGVGSPDGLDWAGAPQVGFGLDAADWDAQTYYTTTFGQAFTVTVPQVASTYQIIANDGKKMPLSLVESCVRPDGTVEEPDLPEPEQVIKATTAQQVSDMLENVYSEAWLADDIAIPGYRVASKTGTAEVTDGNGGYKQGIYFTSLVGYAPADDPQYVVVTVFDEPMTETGSGANRSMFKKALTQVLTHYRIMPSNSPVPLLPQTK
ncbi:peptidoglycan D,D-transpeptidase FtsI family protein [Microbacterium sp. No. 7]|uniref:peptidoglycan D,D-transpeptidase FtsI family protein n=1 Tax=Microbacterium sp. No. 7 TaxID=1714373 RepID=UPI0006D2785B|nr:penicillin-binding protein 2 [Microbacterium sp. No. 7]ALJ20815.1 cell division protein FtsI [Microbacterium sp. No. 7]